MYYVVITRGQKQIIEGKKNWVEYSYKNPKSKAKKFKEKTEAENELNRFLENNQVLKNIEILNLEDQGLRCFYDSEFNAFDYNNGLPQEVISIGLVIMDADGNFIDQYYSTISMKTTPNLSNRCKKITGLTDDEIKKSPSFKIVSSEISIFLKKYNIDHILALGSEDLKQFIITANLYERTKSMNRIEAKFINARRLLRKMTTQEIGDMGLKYLKQICGLDDNVAHNALEDAKDLAKVYYTLSTVGYSEDVLNNIIENRKKERLYVKSRNIEDEKLYAPNEVIIAKNLLTQYLRSIKNASINPVVLKAIADDLDSLIVDIKEE